MSKLRDVLPDSDTIVENAQWNTDDLYQFISEIKEIERPVDYDSYVEFCYSVDSMMEDLNRTTENAKQFVKSMMSYE